MFLYMIIFKFYSLSSTQRYLIVFILDTVVGVYLTIMLMRFTASLLSNYPKTQYLSRIGDYESAPNAFGVRQSSTKQEVFFTTKFIEINNLRVLILFVFFFWCIHHMYIFCQINIM